MRIGIDARELCGQSTGVGRYLGGLLAQWSTDARARSHEFVLYAHDSLSIPLDTRRFVSRVVPGTGGTWWEQKNLPVCAARDHLDVFFAPAYTAPLTINVPTVVTIHDASFAAHPEWFTTRDGIRRRFLTRRSAARARAVITVSQFSRRELVQHLAVPDSRIHVIPPGVSVAPGVRGVPTNANSGSTGSERVLYVGSIFNRRHVPELIRAFSAAARVHPEMSMDIVGDNRSYPRVDIAQTIARANLDGRVRWQQYVADQQLATLYRSARVFAYLSEYEGLGLTPLEALAAGIPPVLLDTPVARESCGEAALYVATRDAGAVAAALERLMFDAETRRCVLGHAAETLARYEWRRSAAATLDVLERSAP